MAGGVCIGSDVLYAMVATFSLTYVSQVLKLPRPIARTGVLAGAALQLFLIPARGVERIIKLRWDRDVQLLESRQSVPLSSGGPMLLDRNCIRKSEAFDQNNEILLLTYFCQSCRQDPRRGINCNLSSNP
ncbi:hypothetical protein PPGU19_088220 (plasmid) [Paraburkholderia sp. PGU19]|nr:hypothetical protein PPGU19_088220 [Paraburkholderia sp. PGU19]